MIHCFTQSGALFVFLGDNAAQNSTTSIHYEEDIHPPCLFFFPSHHQQCCYGLRSCGNGEKYGSSDAELIADVAKLIKYPKDCDENEIQGVVVVRFTISAKGKAGGFSILKSLHPSADAEAIRAVKELPNKWKPALDSKGKPVSSNFVLPIVFRLN